MIRTLMVSSNLPFLSTLTGVLKENDLQVTTTDHSRTALSIMASQRFDLLIVDEKVGGMTGLQLIERVVSKHPMVNCVAVSTLPPEEFHEASEGMGVMMQLPAKPDREDAEKILVRLKKIKHLMNPTG